MDNKKIIWAKTLLICYKYLGRICDSIDVAIEKLATNSRYYGGEWKEYQSVYFVANKILELTQKKQTFINIKVLVEKALAGIDKKYAKLLILKYIKELNNITICNLLNITERNSFRILNKGISSFYCSLKLLGYNFETIEKKFGEDEFIVSIFNFVNEDKYYANYISIDDEFIPTYLLKITKIYA